MSTAGSRPAALPASVAVGATLAGAAAMILGGVALGRLAPDLDLRIHIIVGSVLLTLPTAVLLLVYRPSVLPDTLALARLPARAVGLSILLGGALWVLSIGLMELQAMLWPPSPEYLAAFRAIHAALAPDGPLDAALSVFAIALAPAIGEEIVTRGVLLPSLYLRLGPVGAVLGSAVLFAAIHMDAYRFAFTLVIGLSLGTVRVLSRSLWPSIVAHAALNTLTFLVAPLVDDPSQTTYTPQPLLGVVSLVAGAALALPFLKALRRPEAVERSLSSTTSGRPE